MAISRQEASEDTVYVAVGKDVKECKVNLVWALQNSGGKRICILHVHQPAQLIPGGMGAKVPASSLKEEVVREYRETERQKMHNILDKYLQICLQMGVRAQKLYIETGNIEKGIVDLISQHLIRQLIMGAAADKVHSRKMMEIRSSKAKYVCEQAAAYCRIQFICKAHLIFTREASANTETVISRNQMRSHSFPVENNTGISKTGQSDYSTPRSATVVHRGGNGQSIFDIPFPEGSEEPSFPGSRVYRESSFDNWDSASKSPSWSSSSTGSPGRVFDVPPTSWRNENENGRAVDVYSASSYSRNSSTVEYVGPSLQPSSSFISGPSTPPRCSSSSYDGNLDNSLYNQLQQAMDEAEKETIRRQKAEKDMVEAKRKAQEEMMQRKEIEEALAKEREELENVKIQRDELELELMIFQERELALKSQLGKLQKERDELQMERNNALKEVEGLRRKQENTSSGQMPQFSEFSLAEIEEATQNFHESLKIGQGGYGSIFKGLLHRTEVAIKRLETEKDQGISEFQMEVRVLSQLRHPNLVRLLGFCPKVFALIYEYLPNGSLEDRLKRRDNSPPLSWQARIRIAAELCSVLVYLHNNKPDIIVHGDLKPSNILLDANFVSKLSDFGICRMLRDDKNSSNNITVSHVTIPKGTLPYIDPEFLETGVLTRKSDVYSFGIIILQLLTGRSPFSLANEVQYAIDTIKLRDLLDPSAGDWPDEDAQRLAHLGLMCCDRSRKSRPDLGLHVLKVLEPMRASCGASSSFHLGF